MPLRLLAMAFVMAFLSGSLFAQLVINPPGGGGSGGSVLLSAGQGISVSPNPITGTGRISCPNATSTTPGCMQPDNSTITVNGSGIISTVGGGGTGSAAALGSITGTTSQTLTCPSSSAGTVVAFIETLAQTVTSSSWSGCTNYSTVWLILTQAASGGPYTFTTPAGSDKCSVSLTTSPPAVTTCSFDFDGSGNAHTSGEATTDTPTLIQGVESSTALTSISGTFQCRWDSTLHNMRCNENASGNDTATFLENADCVPATGICTKSNGTSFGTAAFDNTGTSGATIPLLNGNNTFSGSNAYGTPASLTLTNATGLPVTGLSSLGTGVATALGSSVSGSGGICLASGSACAGSTGGGVTGWGGSTLTFSSTTTQYAPPSGGAITNGTETVVSVAAPAAALYSNLKVSFSAQLGASATLAVTLEDGTATPSTLTCTTSSGGTSCSDTTHTVSVSQGDLLSFKLVSSGSVTAGTPQITITYSVGVPGTTIAVSNVTNAVANNTANSYSGGGLQDFSVNALRPVCAAIGQDTDYLANSTVSAQTFTSACQMAGAATSTTVDGVHKLIHVNLSTDTMAAASSQPTITFGLNGCPVANWSAGSCSSGGVNFYSLPAASLNSGGGTIPDILSFIISANGATAGIFNVAKPRGSGTSAITSINSGTTIKQSTNCTSCTGGQWVLYFTLTASSSTVGSAVCLGNSTGYNTCVGIGTLEAWAEF